MRSFIIILFLANSLYVSGQTATEISILKEHKTGDHIHKQTQWAVAKNNNSTMEIMLSSMFLFYKYFISSQDSQSCAFHQSCSVYAVETIKKQGFVLGIMDTFDRLMRCNGFSPDKYTIDKNSRLLIDPVRNYKYKKI